MKSRLKLILLLLFAVSLWGCESDDYKALEGAVKKLDVAFKDYTREIPSKPFVLPVDSEARNKVPGIIAEYDAAEAEFIQAESVPRLQVSGLLGQAASRLARSELQARVGNKEAANSTLSAAGPIINKLSEARESLDSRQKITLAGLTSYYWYLSSEIAASDEKRIALQMQSVRWAIRGLDPKVLADYSGLENFSPEHLRFIGARACAAYGHRQLVKLAGEKLSAEEQASVEELRTEFLGRLQETQKLLSTEPATQIIYYRAQVTLLGVESQLESELASAKRVPSLVAKKSDDGTTVRLENELFSAFPSAADNAAEVKTLLAKPEFAQKQEDGTVVAAPKNWTTLRTKLCGLCNSKPEDFDKAIYVSAASGRTKLAGKNSDDSVTSLKSVGAMVKEFESQLLDLSLDKNQDYLQSPVFLLINQDLKPNGTFFKQVNTLKGQLIPLESAVSLSLRAYKRAA